MSLMLKYIRNVVSIFQYISSNNVKPLLGT